MDMCAAVLLLLKKGELAETYNIGHDNEYSVLQIAKMLVDLMDPHHSKNYQDYMELVEDRYYNDFTYRIDSTKLRRLGWEPQIEMTEGLKSVVEWYHKNHHLYSSV
jgi:dTDP-glucose 4,6-dehydratase